MGKCGRKQRIDIQKKIKTLEEGAKGNSTHEKLLSYSFANCEKIQQKWG